MITKDGGVKVLGGIIAGNITAGWIRLSKVNPSPADADLVLSDLTEADFSGYAAKALNGVSFPTPTLNVSDEGESDSPNITWTAGSGSPLPQTCYMVYITLIIGGVEYLYGVGRFSPGKTVTAGGDTIVVKLNLFAWDGVP